MILTPIDNLSEDHKDSERELSSESMCVEIEKSPFLLAVREYIRVDQYKDLLRKIVD